MDPIADMLTIIRNGCRAKKIEVTVSYSLLKT
jgi:ribosomal protein S8